MTDVTERIAKYKELLDSGALTQEEFDALKAKALAEELGGPVVAEPEATETVQNVTLTSNGKITGSQAWVEFKKPVTTRRGERLTVKGTVFGYLVFDDAVSVKDAEVVN